MTFGRDLVVLNTTPFMFGMFLVHAWRYCGGSNEVHSISVHGESNLIWHAKGAKMSLALNELKKSVLHSNSNNTSEHAPQAERKC